ncbi:hypothetical protein DH2020_041959 [Rehmannia glutinosa]|uniref:Cystatin domain-containing protein n=1 Tax=Rehmannia glutinosa TaxID=99300 RepID=A0ABR0UQ52_REHGL
MAPFLFIFLSILVVLTPNEASAYTRRELYVPGGWWPIDNPKDPEVVDVAKFAVAEHNKEANTTLSFVTVVKGEQQVVAGTNYRLDISAKDGGAADSPKNYRAAVFSPLFKKPWQNRYKVLIEMIIEDSGFKKQKILLIEEFPKLHTIVKRDGALQLA